MTDLERYQRALAIWQAALSGFLVEYPIRIPMVENATKRIIVLSAVIRDMQNVRAIYSL